MTKVAIVTGSNKGIGLAIVRGLCKNFNGVVYLTARNPKLGEAAVAKLNSEGLNPKFHQLDIDDDKSIKLFVEYIKNKYGGLDVLINNAAIVFQVNEKNPEPLHIQADSTIRINYYDNLKVYNAFYPLLRQHARVVHVSSRAGLLNTIKNERIQKRLIDKNSTLNDIDEVIKEYVQSCKNNKHVELGFPDHPWATYGTSKVFFTAATLILQRLINNDKSKKDVIINACCPGFVDTDMNNHLGRLTPDQGAETPLYLALLPENVNEPKGQFLAEKKIIDFADPKPWSP